VTDWIRFSRDEAVRAGDGLFSGASGNPNVPRWVGRALMGLFLPSAPKTIGTLGKCATPPASPCSSERRRITLTGSKWALLRAIRAAGHSTRHSQRIPDQPVEVAAIRPQFASWLGLGDQRPDLVVRFGRGPKMPASLRRPVESVLVSGPL
jgi:hypothetical protein